MSFNQHLPPATKPIPPQLFSLHQTATLLATRETCTSSLTHTNHTNNLYDLDTTAPEAPNRETDLSSDHVCRTVNPSQEGQPCQVRSSLLYLHCANVEANVPSVTHQAPRRRMYVYSRQPFKALKDTLLIFPRSTRQPLPS